MPAIGEFRLSITRALGDQLAVGLQSLTPAPLTDHELREVQPRPGVYQLHEDNELVYVGKADGSLRARLGTHLNKLSGRLNVGQMTFACMYVEEDLHAVAPEQLLVKQYKDEGQAAWNFNGFGGNDPGKNRDETVAESDHFDSIHPANLDLVCEDIAPGVYTATDLLTQVKATLPYNFRYQSAPFHQTVQVTVPMTIPTARELFELLGNAIADTDPEWQITALPGYVIMYPKKGPFPSSRETYP